MFMFAVRLLLISVLIVIIQCTFSGNLEELLKRG